MTDAVPKKYGTFTGVYVPSILTILGVIMYLRAGWVVANAGLFGAILILVIASSITFITGLATSATATNMRIKGGGVYFMVSRCFGVEAGAAIGIPLFLAQVIGITFYTAGFAESAVQVFPFLSAFWISNFSLIALAALSYYAPDIAFKGQNILFVIIMLSIVSFIMGSPAQPDTVAAAPFESASFWTVFAVFFPAVTGITTGISMSGDLKSPEKSIPTGTIAAVISGFIIYLVILIYLDKFASPEALNANPLIMTSIAAFPLLVIAGVWCSTLSSALGSLLAGPRTLQSMAKDGIGPRIFAKGQGINQDPRAATAFSFLLALSVNFLGGIDVIAPILTMFFLTSYGALNLAAGLEGLTNNPSWRPTFNTPWVLSLAGAGACFVAMLFIDAQATFVSVLFCVGIFAFMRRVRKKRNWSDIRRGLLLHMARFAIYRLANIKEKETGRNWRPNMLVLSGTPTSRWHLIDFANSISQGRGFLIVASILSKSKMITEKVDALQASMMDFLNKKNVPGLSKVKVVDNYIEGVENLISDFGIGSIVPNTVVLGTSEEEKLNTDYSINMSSIITAIHKHQRNLVLVRESTLSKDDTTAKDRIDIWWGRDKNNATLMLAFSYLLQTSANWIGTELVLKSIVETAKEKEGVLKYLHDFVGKSRIQASVQVYVKDEANLTFDEIRKYSKGAGIVFFGMAAPEDNDSPEEYGNYYRQLQKNTDNFPQIAYILSGEPLSFEDLFI